MAVTSVCGTLRNGQDNSCPTTIQRKYYQQAVIINRTSINYTDAVYGVPTEEECGYNVQFALKTGETGYRISGSEQGSSFKGFYDKSLSDLGNVQYAHQVQLLIMGVSEETKCILNALDQGSFVVALQNGDIVEIFGFNNGLGTGDYTYDVQENGGGTLITLTSAEDNNESKLPMVYKSETTGGEIADFDALFANTAPSV